MSVMRHHTSRHALLSGTAALFTLLALLVVMPFSALAKSPSEVLTVYSGAGLMHPMDELIRTFEETNPGVDVQVNYAGSGEHFGMMAVQQTGDVFVPGSDKFMEDALKKGFVRPESVRTLCYHVPVILTPAGNPAGVHTLEDMARPGIRLGIGDPQATAIGKIARKFFEREKLTAKVTPNVVVRPITVNQLLIYTATGQVDAVLAWEDQALWAEGKGKVNIVDIPASRNIIKTIPAGVISFTENPEWAELFVSWISSEEGKAIWERWEFPVTKPE